MQIHIEGLDSVSDMINRYADGITENLSKGIAVGCKIVEGEAKSLCPVSTEETRPGGPHGELRQSITSQVDGLTGDIGTSKEYSAYVEFGTYKMAAQPYLVPALKSKQSDVIAAIAAEFKR